MKVEVESFEYPARKKGEVFTLKEISFSAVPGELVGIVGQSGSGKSTLLKILSTDIVADKARISLFGSPDNIVFSGEDLESLLRYKSQVSIVSQDSHVFSSSLRFNITLDHRENERFDEFWQNVGESIPYVRSWKIAPEDNINPKELSLGQKQLLSALRSCFLVKPIVLFDEISSGLDSELEEALRMLVLLIQKKSLTFIVAHRIETILEAQKILVMKDGELVAQGTHHDLKENSAAYQEFFNQVNKY